MSCPQDSTYDGGILVGHYFSQRTWVEYGVSLGVLLVYPIFFRFPVFQVSNFLIVVCFCFFPVRVLDTVEFFGFTKERGFNDTMNRSFLSTLLDLTLPTLLSLY